MKCWLFVDIIMHTSLRVNCLFSFVLLLGCRCWQVQHHCFLGKWLYCRQEDTTSNSSDYVCHHRYCRLRLWVQCAQDIHQCASFSKCAYVYICRPVGEITLTVGGGSVRLNFWDTCGLEEVSLIWSSHLASYMYMCLSSSSCTCTPAVSYSNNQLL